jgi:hypothetical protein
LFALFGRVASPAWWEAKIKTGKFNLHDTWAARQIGVGVGVGVVHLSVFGFRVVLSAGCVCFHLLFEGEGVREHSKALVELPAASFANRLRAADGLGQHERTNDAEELDESNREGSRGDQHCALLNDIVEARQAAVSIKVIAGFVRSDD